MLALDPPARRARRSAASSPPPTPGPLRHRYGAVRDLVLGIHRRDARRHGRARGRQGHQERRRLRPRQALGRRVRHARRRSARSASACTRVPADAADRRDRAATTRRALAAARARADPPAAGGRVRSTSAGTAAAARPRPPRRARRRPTRARRARRRRGRRTTTTALWARAARRPARPTVVVRVSTTQTGLAAVLAPRAASSAPRCVARAALGLAWLRLDAGRRRRRSSASARRCRAAPCVLLDAPAELRARRRPVGRPRRRAALMRRVKARFDPLAPATPASSSEALTMTALRRPQPARARPRSTTACTAASACRRARPTRCGARRWTRRAGASC